MNKAIYEKVLEHPGISIAKLIAHVAAKFPDEPENKIKKTIANMVHSIKKLRYEGSGKDRTLHLNMTAKSVPTSAPASSFSEPEKPEIPETQDDSGFSLMLSDENCLYIRMGANETRLNPIQLARLDSFLARVLPDGVRNLDGVRVCRPCVTSPRNMRWHSASVRMFCAI